jgi:hypothetical protein
LSPEELKEEQQTKPKKKSMKKFSYVSVVTATLLAASLTTTRLQAQEEEPCEDRVTSGGWIVPGENRLANFGAGGGIHQGELWGYLTYVDHNTSPPTLVSAQEVVGYCEVACAPEGCETRRITYANATIRSGNTVCTNVTVIVEVTDCGEPGTADTFAICIPASGEGCLAGCFSGVLGNDEKPSGGNVQVHQPETEGCIPTPICEDILECGCFLECFDE